MSCLPRAQPPVCLDWADQCRQHRSGRAGILVSFPLARERGEA
jgi:hypothetical protein